MILGFAHKFVEYGLAFLVVARFVSEEGVAVDAEAGALAVVGDEPVREEAFHVVLSNSLASWGLIL